MPSLTTETFNTTDASLGTMPVVLPKTPAPIKPIFPIEPNDVSRPPAVRVLHVINGEHYSGAERVQDLLAQCLPALGYEVGFATLKPGRFAEARRSTNAPIHNLEMTSRWDLRVVKQITRLAADEGYELIHAHTPRSVMVGSRAAKRAGLPLVYHVHSPAGRDSTQRIKNWLNQRVENASIRNAAQLIAVSPTLVDQMLMHGAPADRLCCVRNGVPAVPDVQPRNPPTGAWTLGMAALFRPRKGVEVLLESLAVLRRDGHDVRLRAIGPFETPDYEIQVKRLAHRLGVEESIEWTGFRDDIAAEFSQIDMLVLPSLFGEGLPMVVLEAMASALPVVATQCDGVAEAVEQRRTGLLVKAQAPRQLASSIESILSGAVDYHSMSAAALRRHAEAFSARGMAARVADVYRKVLSSTPVTA